MFKKIMMIVLAAVFAMTAGCVYDKADSKAPADQREMVGVSFNQEHYIWESFIFPTNRTETIRR